MAQTDQPIEQKKPHETDHFSAMQESERWAKEAERGLLGTREETAGDVEAQKAWDRLHLYPAYRQEKGVIRAMLANMANRLFQSFAKRLESEEKIREVTREKLNILERESREFFEAAGKSFRAKAGFHEVAEEEEVLAISSFVNALRNIENPDEFLRVLEEDQGYIRMMAEMHHVPPPRMDDLNDPLASADPRDLLDLEHPNYADNIASLKYFIQSTNKEKGSKSADRKNLEAIMWGAIVKKMNHEQLIDLFDSFCSEGETGTKEANNLLVTCVRSGVISHKEAVDVLGDSTLAPRDDLDRASILKELDGARNEFVAFEKATASAVNYMKMRVHGNPAKEKLTFNNILIGRLFEFGILTAAFNAVIEVTSRYKEQKTLKGKMKAIGEGLAATATNPYFHLGLLEVGVATDVVAGGIVREKLLYSSSKEQQKGNLMQEVQSSVRTTLGKYPGLGDYVFAHYDLLLQHAYNNQVLGHGFVLREADLKLQPDHMTAFQLPNTPEGRKKAIEAVNDAFHFFARVERYRDWAEVGNYLERENLPFDRTKYPEYQERLDFVMERLGKYPGLAKLFVNHTAELAKFTDGKSDGAAFDLDAYLEKWGYRDEAAKEGGRRLLRATANEIFNKMKEFHLAKPEEFRRFFIKNKLT